MRDQPTDAAADRFGGRVVVDPLAPDRDALIWLVGRTHDLVLNRPDPRRVPRLPRALAPRRDVALALATTGGSTGLLAGSVAVGVVTAVAAAIVAAGVRAVALARQRGEQRALLAARPYYIVVPYLSRPGRELLERAQAAADAISGSRTCSEGLADPQETAAFLREEVWGIAAGLRDVAGLGEPPADKPAPGPASEARAERLAAIEGRLEALEDWAAQVERVDQQLAAASEQGRRSPTEPDLDRVTAVRAAAVVDRAGRQDSARRAADTAALADRLSRPGGTGS